MNCDFPDLKHSCALICHSCGFHFNNIFKLQGKINELKDGIKKSLSKNVVFIEVSKSDQSYTL